MEDIKEVSVHFIEENLKDIYIINVREPEEDEEGTIPGVINIPLGELEDRIDELPKDKTIYIHCRSGNRSGRATRFLTEKGYDAANVAGGIQAWNSIKLNKKA